MSTTFIVSGKQSTGAVLEALYDLPPSPFLPISHAEFNPSEGYEVGMNCAAITNSNSVRPVLGTLGVRTCMGIALFNERTMTGALTHLASAEGEASLSQAGSEILKRVLKDVGAGNSAAPVDVRIVGPWGAMSGQINRDIYRRTVAFAEIIGDVVGIINMTPGVRILSADMAGKTYPKDFGIDTRRWQEGIFKGSFTGNVMFGANPLTPAEVLEVRKGYQYVVDITSLESAPFDASGYFDGRSRLSRLQKPKQPSSHL